jgi:quercetin dioxygenase-like cupin family protein
MTIARFHLKKGAIVPEHSHTNAQLSNVLSGSLTFNMQGKSLVIRAGESLTIEPNIPHEAIALEDCDAIDVFVPERADWIKKDDAYLRQGKK